MSKRVGWILLCGALTACRSAGGGGSVTIHSKTTEPSSLNMSIDGSERKWVKVWTADADTLIDFRGREFVFRNLTGYEGRISLDEVELEIGDTEVEITERVLRVTAPNSEARFDHWRLAPGKRVVYASGSIGTE
ncbi:MAG: hypothetical protein ACE5JG_09460 [Planctomycetota bacterium]